MDRRNFLVEFIMDHLGRTIIWSIILILLCSWFFTDFLPAHRAKAFFNELDKKPGFEKLVDNRSYSKTKDVLNIGEMIEQGIDIAFDKTVGYEISTIYNNGYEIIESLDLVDIYDVEGNFIATGQYEGYWSSTFSYISNPDYHIICIDAPIKGYDKEFKIDARKVVLKLKSLD